MNDKHVLFAALTCAASITGAQATETVAPGLWSEQVSHSMDQGHTWRARPPVKHCVSAQQAATPSERLRELIEAEGCSTDGVSVAKGRIEGVVVCTSHGGARIKLSGQYSDTRYNVTGDATGQAEVNGQVIDMPLRIQSRWTGQRVGACS
ncbi:MAG: DUF3617 domain-containing protein [Proteobacteria bacterium]|nr:DUF3617 domain-containing protein [Pseudomonadota bacterium]